MFAARQTANNMSPIAKKLYLHFLSFPVISEVVSRTQSSRPRPRTQKKMRGQGQPFRGQTLLKPRTKDTGASVLKKKVFKIFFFWRSPEKNVFQKFFLAMYQILTIQKLVLSSSRRQGSFRGNEASRPSPRT